MPKPPQLLCARVDEDGHALKLLAELIDYLIKSVGYLSFDGEGIHGSCMDENKRVSVIFDLKPENFQRFDCESPRNVSIDAKLLHSSLKSIKRKDGVSLSISKDEPNKLRVTIISKDGQPSWCDITIRDSSTVKIQTPEYDAKPICILFKKYQDLCKNMGNRSKTVQVTLVKPSLLKFYSNGDDIIEQGGYLGEDDDQVPENEEAPLQSFPIQYISRVAKMARASKNIKIYFQDGLPLMFRIDVGSLGTASIFLKSNELVEEEEAEDEEEES